MRRDLINAGADVQEMKGDSFIATVSSDDLYHVAALGFLTKLQLWQESERENRRLPVETLVTGSGFLHLSLSLTNFKKHHSIHT